MGEVLGGLSFPKQVKLSQSQSFFENAQHVHQFSHFSIFLFENFAHFLAPLNPWCHVRLSASQVRAEWKGSMKSSTRSILGSLVGSTKSMELHMAIEIVSFPINSMVIFHRFFVCLPEGIPMKKN